MATRTRSLETLDRCSNHAGLDFVNTVHSRFDPNDAHDYLQSYADLSRWARDGGLLTESQHRRLVKAARARPRLAARTLQRALELRDTLYRLFLAQIHEKRPASDDIAVFNRELSQVLSRRRVAPSEAELDWSWENDRDALDRPLWPVILAAAELLASGERRRLKECPAPDGCGWLFLDKSKNGTRRWCSMRTCGNIAKARRHYRRHARRL